MSATINIKLFSDYFSEENARVIEVPGRLYPIKLHYMPQVQDSASNTRQSKSDRISPEPFIQIMQLIDNKYPSTEKGDLLIFMSGLSEITSIADAAKEYAEKSNNWIILPLHSSLSIADQDKVWKMIDRRKSERNSFCVTFRYLTMLLMVFENVLFQLTSLKRPLPSTVFDSLLIPGR